MIRTLLSGDLPRSRALAVVLVLIFVGLAAAPFIFPGTRALNVAARHLERAEHDFGGHRAKALELVKQAENELEAALAYAKANPEKGARRAPGGTPAPGGGTPTMPAPKTQ